MLYDKQQGDTLQSLAQSFLVYILGLKTQTCGTNSLHKSQSQGLVILHEAFLFYLVLMVLSRTFAFGGYHTEATPLLPNIETVCSAPGSCPELKVTYNQLVLPKTSASAPLLCQRPWYSLAEGRRYPCS